MHVSGAWRFTNVRGIQRTGQFRAAQADARWVLEDGEGQLLALSDFGRDFGFRQGILVRVPSYGDWADNPAGLLLRPEVWGYAHRSAWIALDDGRPVSMNGRACTVRRSRLASDAPIFDLWIDDASGLYLRFEGHINTGMPLSVKLDNVWEDDQPPDWAAQRFRLIDEYVDSTPPELATTSAVAQRAVDSINEFIMRLAADAKLLHKLYAVQAIDERQATTSWLVAITVKD